MKRLFILVSIIILSIVCCLFVNANNKESLKGETVIKETNIVDKTIKTNTLPKQSNKSDEDSITTDKEEIIDDVKEQVKQEVNISSNKTSNVSVNTSSSVETKEDYVSNEAVVVEKQQEPVYEPVKETVKEEPVVAEETPSYACPNGVDRNIACDVILDSNYYYATFSSESEADSSGDYYLNEVMYIGDIEITNYSVQPVYRNDHSVAYYGLNLWSDGSLIQ